MAFKSFTLLRQITWNETIYSLSSQEYQQLKELKYNELITFLKLASQRKYTLTSCQRYGLDKVALNLIILNRQNWYNRASQQLKISRQNIKSPLFSLLLRADILEQKKTLWIFSDHGFYGIYRPRPAFTEPLQSQTKNSIKDDKLTIKGIVKHLF